MKYVLWVYVISVSCISYAAEPTPVRSAVVPGMSYAKMVAVSSHRFAGAQALNRACQERDDWQRHKKLCERMHDEFYEYVEYREAVRIRSDMHTEFFALIARRQSEREQRQREEDHRIAQEREQKYQEIQRKRALWYFVRLVNRGGPLKYLDEPLRKALSAGACIADLLPGDQAFIFGYAVSHMPDMALIMSRDVDLDVVRKKSCASSFLSILDKLVHYARVYVVASLIERGLQLSDWREHWKYCLQQVNHAGCSQEKINSLMRCVDLLQAYGDGDLQGLVLFQKKAEQERLRIERLKPFSSVEDPNISLGLAEPPKNSVPIWPKSYEHPAADAMELEELPKRSGYEAAAVDRQIDVLWWQITSSSKTPDRRASAAKKIKYESDKCKLNGHKSYARRGNNVQQPPRKGARHSHCS